MKSILFVFAFVLIVSVSSEINQLTEDEVNDLRKAYNNPKIESRFGDIVSSSAWIIITLNDMPITIVQYPGREDSRIDT